MSTRLVTLVAEENVSLAEQLMQAVEVRHLPVLGPGDRLVGMVSDRDLLSAAASSLAGLQEEDEREFKRMIPVESIMTRELFIVAPTTPLLEAARIMRDRRVGSLPVVEDDALVGILTETDLLQTLIDALAPNEDPPAAPPQSN